LKVIEFLRRMAQATPVYPLAGASGYNLEPSSRQELFGRGLVVLGKIFSECLYDRVGESQFVVYAIMGDSLL
jgi:hypothetical protein